MGLERLVEMSNRQYEHRGVAVVQKVPTPMVPRSENGVLTGVRLGGKSTVDFVGCLAPAGRMVAFDVKECREKSRFPFDKRWEHEVEFLRSVIRAGGVAFLLVELISEGCVWFVPADELSRRWHEAYVTGTGPKSIPLAELQRMTRVGSSTAVPVDWLTAVRAM